MLEVWVSECSSGEWMATLCELVCLGIGWYGACAHVEPHGAVMHVQHEGFWGSIFGTAVWGNLLGFVSC